MLNDNSVNNDTQIEDTAIKALAMTSKTPFKVAFLATLGIAVAQLAMALAFIILFTTFCGVVYWIIH